MLKSIQQNSTSLHDKGFGESRDTRYITKDNKGNIQPTANIKLNGEKLTVISLKSGTR